MVTGKDIHQLAAFWAGCLAATPNYFDMPRATDNTRPYPKSASLPKWKVGENTIYARNEKDAIKYAKKRGLYKDGDTAVKIENDTQ